MKKIKVAFLLDKSNNWLESDTRAFVKYLKKSKYEFKIYYKYEDIRNYTIVFLLGYTKTMSRLYAIYKRNNMFKNKSHQLFMHLNQHINS